MKLAIKDLPRFYSSVDMPEDPEACWEWTGYRSPAGYGHSGIGAMRSHRASYEIHKGPIPEGLFVLHECDNRGCVNPRHLYAGTHKDNMRDMVERGRSAKGERSGQAKLTADAVLAMRGRRKAGETLESIAHSFGVSTSHTGHIVTGLNWSHVGGHIQSVRSRPTEALVREIRSRASAGETQRGIAAVAGCSQGTVSVIVNRKTWKHVT